MLPVGSVSESNIIIEFPFADIKLAGLYWRFIYRLRQFSMLILFRTFQKQTLCCDETMKRCFEICKGKGSCIYHIEREHFTFNSYCMVYEE